MTWYHIHLLYLCYQVKIGSQCVITRALYASTIYWLLHLTTVIFFQISFQPILSENKSLFPIFQTHYISFLIDIYIDFHSNTVTFKIKVLKSLKSQPVAGQFKKKFIRSKELKKRVKMMQLWNFEKHGQIQITHVIKTLYDLELKETIWQEKKNSS